MEYEIIKKDGSYRIMYKKGDKKVLSNHSFKTEDEAVNFVFNTEHSSHISITVEKSSNDGNKVSIKKEPVKQTMFIPNGEYSNAFGGKQNNENLPFYFYTRGFYLG